MSGDLAMSDDDETHLHVTYASHWDMDVAFCARMRWALAAGLESAPKPKSPNMSEQSFGR